MVELLYQPASDRPVKIALHHLGGDNVGILLDRVTLIEGYEPPPPPPVPPVPLPAPALLLGGGLGLLAVLRRRRT